MAEIETAARALVCERCFALVPALHLAKHLAFHSAQDQMLNAVGAPHIDPRS